MRVIGYYMNKIAFLLGFTMNQNVGDGVYEMCENGSDN